MYLIHFKDSANHKQLSDGALCYGEVIAIYNDPYDDREKCLSNVFPIVKFRPPYNNEIKDNDFIEVTKLSDSDCSYLKTKAVNIEARQDTYAMEIYTLDEQFDVEKWICVLRNNDDS